MSGTLKVDSINADSNLALKIANTAVAFIDSSGLRPVSGNVSLDATATSKVFLPSANTVAIQTAGVTGLSMSSSQVVTLTNALPVGSGGTGNTATPTAGGIIYGTGTVQAVSAAGTSGQLLQSNGASAPTWVTSSGLSAATQAQMETATSNTVAATPLATNWHPGVAKAWIMCDVVGAIQVSHNITSITDGGPGIVTITIATDFSTANYCVLASVAKYASGGTDLAVSNQAAGSFRIIYNLSGTGATDPDNWFAAAFGDQT